MHVKRMIICIFSILISIGAFSQSKIAVLDAIVHSGVKESVAIPITESVIEPLVLAGKFKVLDRAHVAKVIAEQKFQVSGLVKNDDIKKVGEYLGADVIVVINVSIIEDIYFVSAKMIKVESGEILTQASHKKRGDIEVIFEIAETVGAKLAGTATTGSVSYTSESELFTFVGGELRLIELETTDDDYLVFHAYDLMISGMLNKEIQIEFWISQGEDWMPDSKQYFDPEMVLYDPAYWNGHIGFFTYDLNKVQNFGNPSQPYWASFFVINTANDEVVFEKDLQFSLPVVDTEDFN